MTRHDKIIACYVITHLPLSPPLTRLPFTATVTASHTPTAVNLTQIPYRCHAHSNSLPLSRPLKFPTAVTPTQVDALIEEVRQREQEKNYSSMYS